MSGDLGGAVCLGRENNCVTFCFGGFKVSPGLHLPRRPVGKHIPCLAAGLERKVSSWSGSLDQSQGLEPRVEWSRESGDQSSVPDMRWYPWQGMRSVWA